MAKKKITAIAEEILEDFLEDNGYELYSTEFVKEGRDWFLRIFIDLKNADEDSFVGTEDCEKVSRYLSPLLDERDPIEQNYYLEVSSPGMDRPLLRIEHYRKYIGRDVDISLYKAVNGIKSFEGVLEAIESRDDECEVTVRLEDDKRLNLLLSQIAKARLAVKF